MKLRVQFTRMMGTRASWAVCSLLLASTLLAGCNSTGAKSAAGFASSTTAAVSTSATSSVAPTNKSADVSWSPPTTNTNGSALTDLAGYRIYYGTSPDTLNQTIDVANAGATDYVVGGLTQGTWYFAVAAYTNSGLQSGLSSIASKTIS